MTPEVKAATQAVQDAMNAYLTAIEVPADEVLGDWMLVATTVGFQDNGNPKNAYHMLFANGALQLHVAMGLTDMAQDLLLNGVHPDEG
jgi:hypothetical protein